VVYPAFFLFIIGLIVGAAGIFRYQELSSLARRAARYAAVHGTQYAKETGNPAATPADIYNNAVLANSVGLNPDFLSYSVSYSSGTNSTYQTTIVNNQIVAKANIVTVTITYQWIPEAFLGGITLSSTSVMPMAY
jgi:hypothetical protein